LDCHLGYQSNLWPVWHIGDWLKRALVLWAVTEDHTSDFYCYMWSSHCPFVYPIIFNKWGK
jgi:hypothetical protein